MTCFWALRTPSDSLSDWSELDCVQNTFERVCVNYRHLCPLERAEHRSGPARFVVFPRMMKDDGDDGDEFREVIF